MTCTAEGCDRVATRKGLCPAHYEQKRRALGEGKRVRFVVPRTSPGDAGDRIQLRPTRVLRADIERRAAAEGLTVSSWCLAALAKAVGEE